MCFRPSLPPGGQFRNSQHAAAHYSDQKSSSLTIFLETLELQQIQWSSFKHLQLSRGQGFSLKLLQFLSTIEVLPAADTTT
jgi:hypothetical protein